MKVYRESSNGSRNVVFTIQEATYTGQEMGERKIIATIKFPSIIDFRNGDYIEFDMATLLRDNALAPAGGHAVERFYLYTVPTIKKTSSPMSAKDAFEHTVTFYPRQYELGTVMMRDTIQEDSKYELFYTGWDEFSFFGGAHTLIKRVMSVMNARFGEGVWNYVISPDVNEDVNRALEGFQFTFSQNTVQDALNMLSQDDGLHVPFFVTGRTIYVGFRRPLVCIPYGSEISSTPYVFKYGKTSHMPVTDREGGSLYSITKMVDDKSPITRLFAYGGSRNLNRFYCSDRGKSGRYVNKLMLPQFDADGKTDYIESPRGIAKYGIREAGHSFEEIYPSIRYMTYGDLRQIKYVLKLETSGFEESAMPSLPGAEHLTPSVSDHWNICRVQCYKVVPAIGNSSVNRLVPSWPDKPLMVCVHGSGKVLKMLLMTNAADQKAIAGDPKIPFYINSNLQEVEKVGCCYVIHQGTDRLTKRFDNYASVEPKYTRPEWFIDVNDEEGDLNKEALQMQGRYEDDLRITDVYLAKIEDGVITYEGQDVFTRDGYSAYCWPHTNANYAGQSSDATLVNEVVRVGKIKTIDTDVNVAEGKTQPTFDLYIRDVGFDIAETTGNMNYKVHLVGQTFKVSFLDGFLAGMEFEVEDVFNDTSSSVCPAYKNGVPNPDFVKDAGDQDDARAALAEGAFWRLRLRRNMDNWDDMGVVLPNVSVNANAGDKIVFLDIQMPDVYVHAAENRLLTAAQQFLNENDLGSESYVIELDKIRPTVQIPALALQMREGVDMRISDHDLQTTTDNEAYYVYQNEQGDFSSAKFEEPYIIKYEGVQSWHQNSIRIDSRDDLNDAINFSERTFVASVPMASKYHVDEGLTKDTKCNVTLRVILKGIKKIYYNRFNITQKLDEVELQDEEISYSAERIISVERVNLANKITFDLAEGEYAGSDVCEKLQSILTKTAPNNFYYDPSDRDRLYRYSYTYFDAKVSIDSYELITDYEEELRNTVGMHLFVPSNVLVPFRRDKSYTIIIDVRTADRNLVEDQGGEMDANFARHFALASTLSPSSSSLYYPSYGFTVWPGAPEGYERRKYVFYLPESFDDSKSYYPAIQYISDGFIEYAYMRLVSVYVQNIDDYSEFVHYVDLTIDQLTIKMRDSGLEANGTGQELIKEVTATVKQKRKVNQWSAMGQAIHLTAIETSKNQSENTTTRRKVMRTNFDLDNLSKSALKARDLYTESGEVQPMFAEKAERAMGIKSGAKIEINDPGNNRVMIIGGKDVLIAGGVETVGKNMLTKEVQTTLSNVTKLEQSFEIIKTIEDPDW